MNLSDRLYINKKYIQTEQQINPEMIIGFFSLGKAINDLRDLSRSLNGDKIADLGLQEAIDNELKIIQNTGQFVTRLVINGEPYKLLPQNEMVLFRIMQEALNNIVKHSKASTIIVELQYERLQFTMDIIDDGVGFNLSQLQPTQPGIGFNNMKSRAALIGAGLSLDSKLGKGTSIHIQLPNATT